MAPDDPIGTVRATAGTLAVRAHSANHDDELAWFLIDIDGQDLSGLDIEEIEDLIAAWPVVYQPSLMDQQETLD